MIDGMPLAPRPRALVGRGRELDRLRVATGLTGEGRTAGVVLSGDAGIGKSRLVAELGHEAAAAGHSVVVGHCVGAGGSTLAWLPFAEIVAALDEAAPQVVAAILTTHPALASLRPGTGTKPATTPADPSPRNLLGDPGQVAHAVHALLTEAARERPLLVVVEDVHWADDSSRDLLTLLLTRGFTTPVTFVITYRSDDIHRSHPLHPVLTVWTRLPLVTRVDLGPLPAPDMVRLVHDLGPTTGDDLGEVVERSGGNPFFAEELVASGDATSTDLARLLRLRLDSLDDPARQVVRAASLAEGDLDPELLADVTGLGVDALDDALAQAIDHHILETVGHGLRFRHSLLGETLAADLLPGARRRLHTAWIQALRAHPDRRSPADLARHAAATGDTETAISAAVAAGDEAMRVGGVRDAQRLYETAIGWVDDDPGLRGDIALRASRAAERAGSSVRAVHLLEEVLPELDPVEHARTRARVLARAATKYTALDLPSDPVALSTEAIALVPVPLDEEGVAVALDHLDVLVGHRHPEAQAFADSLLDDTGRLGLPRAQARVRMQQARLLSATDPDRAYRDLETTVADPHAGPELVLPALLRLGNLDRQAGRMEDAYAHYRSGVTLADRSQRTWGPYGMECRLQGGRTAYELGRWDEAERLLTCDETVPQPTRGFMEGALVELLVARGATGLEHRLDDTRAWWDVDALLVVGCLGGMIDALGRAGEATRLLEWVVSGTETIRRTWGAGAHALIRIAALLAGQTADLARGTQVPDEVLSSLRETTSDLAARARAVVTGAPEARGPERVGPESLAWAARLDAELARDPRRRATVPDGSDGGTHDPVALWESSAAAFDALRNVPEHARSLLHLAEAQATAGRSAESRATATAARELATRLGARPVLDGLDALDTGIARPVAETASRAEAVAPLTARELEVLALLDRGRTNGDIASELYISRKTASVHVSNILAKLGASTRGEAVSLARGLGLLG